jgi:hypothetical protein
LVELAGKLSEFQEKRIKVKKNWVWRESDKKTDCFKGMSVGQTAEEL